jgi:hypothetical protein
MLCGCEGGVLTLAMRFIGDPSVFSVLLQQMGLACGGWLTRGEGSTSGTSLPCRLLAQALDCMCLCVSLAVRHARCLTPHPQRRQAFL